MKEFKKLLGILILLGIFASGLFFVEAELYFIAIGISIAITALIVFAHHLIFSE